MSELKDRMLGQTMSSYGCDTKIYLKSEADAVIAELKADYKEACDRLHTANLIKDETFDGLCRYKKEVEQLSAEVEELKHQRDGAFGLTNLGLTLDDLSQTARKEINRQKYKRCLAMASRCKAEQTYSSFAIYVTEHPKSRWASKSVPVGAWIEFWKNREQCWLKIAEQFKKVK